MTQMNPAPGNGAANQGAPTPDAGHASPAGAAPAPTQTARVQAVAGPFTARDLLVFAAVLLLFLASLLPMFGRYNLWNLSNLFFLGLGIVLPLIVAALFVARRLQPENSLRIGSLSVDQFASVVASFAVAFYFLSVAVAFSGYLLLGFVGALALLAATVLAPHIPLLRDDFKDRAVSAAHPVARDAVAPVRKPAAPKPAAPKPAAAKPAGPASAVPAAAGPAAGAPAPGGPFAVPTPVTSVPSPVSAPSTSVPSPVSAPSSAASAASGESRTESPEGGTPAAGTEAPAAAPAAPQGIPATMAHPVVDRTPDATAQEWRPVESIGATVDPASRPEESQEPAYEAFWFAVPQPRVAVDEHSGAPAFTLEPGGWVLALEDRGGEFLVQNTDGRLGVLRDLSHIERG